jgi:hypothetical protein
MNLAPGLVCPLADRGRSTSAGHGSRDGSGSRSHRMTVGAQATPLASENHAPSDGGSQSRWRPISRRIAQ